AKYVVERISQPEFLAHVNEVGDYLMERLQEINSPHIKEVRGKGLMVGVEFTLDVAPIIEAGYKHGLIMVNAGQNVIRFVPPLVVQKQHVDALVERLTTVLANLS
ncbi:MAG TPA: aminotransferase class III-fold pyridoxal phosphate-dependent enzyme, partial [Oceanobacillus sp.]|nr:aminotransferase class III-fold pyridoxal phosphate-dependent enzyme [Oceanobacillus sp.]